MHIIIELTSKSLNLNKIFFLSIDLIIIRINIKKLNANIPKTLTFEILYKLSSI
jgi:hypothetical protein